MSTMQTVVAEVVTALGSGSIGAVVHALWADGRKYLASHKTQVEAGADKILNEGIDVLAEVPAPAAGGRAE